MKRSVAAVGDVTDARCWSGIPLHFWHAAREVGFAQEPWRVHLNRITWQRWVWNAVRSLGEGRGGFQYSEWFLQLSESQIPEALWATEVIAFNQHFPRAATITQHGGTLNHYLDAPFAALVTGRGLDLKLPPEIVKRALKLERENYEASHRVVVMARWAAEVMKQECGVPESKLTVIMPGANLNLPTDWEFPKLASAAGTKREFVLGFVGNDWKRKQLPLVISVRDELERRGWKARVLAAGEAPSELRRSSGVEFVGFINKHDNPWAFLRFLTACDVGCLLSDREAFGISTLEFLRAGVPVVGFVHEGPADAVPPDAGFRFERGCSVERMADELEAYIKDESQQILFRANAKQWSSLVTWERCIREFEELWATGTVANPVQPWRGLTQCSVTRSLCS